MDYISAKDAAGRWGVTLRTVQRYCDSGRIPGAKKYGVNWLLPLTTEKPSDLRRNDNRPSESAAAAHIIAYSRWPRNDPEAVLLTLGEPYYTIGTASLAAYRGDYEPAKQCWKNTSPDDPAILTVAFMASAASISSGDYALFHEIQSVLDSYKKQVSDPKAAAMLSLAEVLATVNLSMPDIAPEWLKNADFTLFSANLRPFLLYLYALHLRNIRDLSGARAVAQATLALTHNDKTFTWMEIYLHLLLAGFGYYYGDMDETRRRLADALALGAPHGLIAPYAEWLTGYGGIMEEMLSRDYPELLAPVTELWRRVNRNWMRFRNRYTSEHITTILTAQEQHAALLYARGMTYRQTAKILGLSESRTRTMLSEVYSKLSVRDKKELRNCLLTY